MCGCNQSNSEYCTNCGDPCNQCNCPVVTPEVECPDPEPCDNIQRADCVQFTEPIECEPVGSPPIGPADLYPDVIHHIVPDSDDAEDKRLTAAMRNINEQFCYIFSKEFIEQLLINIRDHSDLHELFCSIVCTCQCDFTCTKAVNLAVEIEEGGDATVTWDPGAGGSDQILQYKLSAAGSWTDVSLGPTVDSYNLSGLLEDRLYDFRIVTVCDGAQLNTETVQEIVITCPEAETSSTSTSVTLAFTSASTDIDSYQIVWKDPGDNVVATADIPNTGGVNDTVSGLNPSTKYTATVTIHAGDFTKTCSYEVTTAPFECSVPTNVQASLINVS